MAKTLKNVFWYRTLKGNALYEATLSRVLAEFVSLISWIILQSYVWVIGFFHGYLFIANKVFR